MSNETKWGPEDGAASEKRVRSAGGFTLLEIMLTLMLVAIVMSFLYGVLVATMKDAQRIEDETAVTEIGPSLLQQIRSDLESVVQPDTQKEYFVGLDQAGGHGSRDRVDFLASVMSYGATEAEGEAAFQSINEIGYQIQDSQKESGVGVLYRRLDYFIDEDPLKGGRLVELYPRVLNFDVTFYDGKEWLKEWATLQKQGALPEAVKVELTILVKKQDKDIEQTFSTVVAREK